jgi:hypothetical protein
LEGATRLAVERPVYVVAPLHELRRVVAVVWAQVVWIDQDVLLRELALRLGSLALSLLCHFGCLGSTLQASAFKDGRAGRAFSLHAA